MPPTILVRESYREDGKVKKRLLDNISGLPADCIATIEAMLAGHTMVPGGTGFETTHTTPHGHVNAILGTMRQIGLDEMIASKPCREQSIIMGLIAERLLHGSSKLAATRQWHATTLAEELDLAEVGVNDAYAAMDWLVARQERIEKKLAKRHLAEGSALDGIYVIRTSESAADMSAADAVRAYKGLAETERVFRGMKGVDNHVRPIFHRSDPRVRAHLFISMLAYYVEWHLRAALAPLLFDDPMRREAHEVRDPLRALRLRSFCPLNFGLDTSTQPS